MADIRTDLAEEAHSFYIKRNNLNKTDGVTARTEKGSVYSVTRVRIETPDAAKRLKKPVGSYVTLHSEHLKTGLYTQELSEAVSREIKKLLPKEKKDPLILVAGLGNKRATPDALGPRVTDQVIITRHMPESDAFSNVCALSPGVLGITGIETAEIFSSVATDVRGGRARLRKRGKPRHDRSAFRHRDKPGKRRSQQAKRVKLRNARRAGHRPRSADGVRSLVAPALSLSLIARY